tara:strand:+ start:508 stop:843 length:336 start_codon:yes stop_codon:yes gene_type:complete
MWEMTRFIKYEGTGMTQINEQELSTLIEETRAAYNDFAEFNPANCDFAGFAAMSVARFRHALNNPALTRETLELLIRGGMNHSRTQDAKADAWSNFMAAYVSDVVNTNTQN